MVAVFLAGEDVADMHFDGRCRNGSNGIVKGDAGVAVAAGIDYDAIGGKAHFVDVVDDFTLDVTLEITYLDVGIALAEFIYILLHCDGAIYLRLSESGEIQIRSINNF